MELVVVGISEIITASLRRPRGCFPKRLRDGFQDGPWVRKAGISLLNLVKFVPFVRQSETVFVKRVKIEWLNHF
jgi:hypothetical protein